MSATIRALSRLLDASYLDEAPTVSQRAGWREDVAKARDEHDRLVAALREIARWREDCHEHDADVGHPPRDMGEDEVAAVERRADRALRGLR